MNGCRPSFKEKADHYERLNSRLNEDFSDFVLIPAVMSAIGRPSAAERAAASDTNTATRKSIKDGRCPTSRLHERFYNRIVDDFYLSYQKIWIENMADAARSIYNLCHGGRQQTLIGDHRVSTLDAIRGRH